MATTALSVLRPALGQLMGAYVGGTTTTKVTTNNSVIDTKLANKYNVANYFRNWFTWINTALNASVDRRVSAHTAAGTLTITGAVLVEEAAIGTAFELHKFDPADMLKAFNVSASDNSDRIYQNVEDESIFLIPTKTVYTIPSGIEVWDLYYQEYLKADSDLNILQDYGLFKTWTVSTRPDGSDAAAGLTLSKMAGEDITEEFNPLHEGYACKTIVTASTSASHYWTALASPAYYEGEQSYYSEDIYSETASRITVAIKDDGSETESSTTHGGTGWEHIYVTHTVKASPSSLQSGIKVSSGTAFTLYRENAMWVRGDRIPRQARKKINNARISDSHIRLEKALSDKRTLVILGRKPLSTLSSDTTTVEIGEPQLQILYAGAALYLYRQNAATNAGKNANPYASEINYWESKLAQYRRQYGMTRPNQQVSRGM